MDSQGLMRGLLRNVLLLSVATLYLAGCRKCVTCEVRVKQSLDVVGGVDEFCGTSGDVEEEEARLKSTHGCIQCTAFTVFGPTGTGMLCGPRSYTDSIEDSFIASGVQYNCDLYPDTVFVSCTLIAD